MLHTKIKVIATGLILSVGLTGCQGLLGSLTGSLLEDYFDDLEADKATVVVDGDDTAPDPVGFDASDNEAFETF